MGHSGVNETRQGIVRRLSRKEETELLKSRAKIWLNLFELRREKLVRKVEDEVDGKFRNLLLWGGQ